MQNLGIFMQQMSNCSIIFAFIGNLAAASQNCKISADKVGTHGNAVYLSI